MLRWVVASGAAPVWEQEAWCSSRSLPVVVSSLGEAFVLAQPMCLLVLVLLKESYVGKSHKDSSCTHRPWRWPGLLSPVIGQRSNCCTPLVAIWLPARALQLEMQMRGYA